MARRTFWRIREDDDDENRKEIVCIFFQGERKSKKTGASTSRRKSERAIDEIGDDDDDDDDEDDHGDDEIELPRKTSELNVWNSNSNWMSEFLLIVAWSFHAGRRADCPRYGVRHHSSCLWDRFRFPLPLLFIYIFCSWNWKTKIWGCWIYDGRMGISNSDVPVGCET